MNYELLKESIEVIGIVGSLLFAGGAFLFDAKVRRIGNLLEASAQHRALWQQVVSNKQLLRLLDDEPDLEKEPITPEEDLYARLIISHVATIYAARASKLLEAHDEMEDDVARLLGKPILKRVWEDVEPRQSAEFVTSLKQLET